MRISNEKWISPGFTFGKGWILSHSSRVFLFCGGDLTHPRLLNIKSDILGRQMIQGKIDNERTWRTGFM